MEKSVLKRIITRLEQIHQVHSALEQKILGAQKQRANGDREADIKVPHTQETQSDAKIKMLREKHLLRYKLCCLGLAFAFPVTLYMVGY